MEDNELIAQFMGIELKYDMMGNDSPDYCAWGNLMKVVEKIRYLGSIDFVISIGGSTIISWDDGVAYYRNTNGLGRKSMETTREAIVEFIKWHNLKTNSADEPA